MSTVRERRLKKEFSYLKKDGYSVDSISEEEVEIKLSEEHVLILILGKSYPFICPEIRINNKPYKEWLYLSPYQHKIFLELCKNKCCLMCTSLACTDNWQVWKTIRHILQDVESNLRLKKNIEYVQCWKEAQLKYNLPGCCLFPFF